MKKLLLTVLITVTALTFGSVEVGATEYTQNGITVDFTNNYGTDVTPSEYLEVYDLTTSGTEQTLWLVSTDAETGTAVLIYKEIHATTSFQSGVGVHIWTDSEMTTQVFTQSDNENFYGAQATGQWETITISGLELDQNYYINFVVNNPDTDPVYDNVDFITIIGNPLNVLIENPSIIVQLMTEVTAIVSGAVTLMVALFSDTGVVAIFYQSGTGLTVLGSLLLMTFGLLLVRWAFYYVRRLVSFRG